MFDIITKSINTIFRTLFHKKYKNRTHFNYCVRCDSVYIGKFYYISYEKIVDENENLYLYSSNCILKKEDIMSKDIFNAYLSVFM